MNHILKNFRQELQKIASDIFNTYREGLPKTTAPPLRKTKVDIPFGTQRKIVEPDKFKRFAGLTTLGSSLPGSSIASDIFPGDDFNVRYDRPTRIQQIIESNYPKGSPEFDYYSRLYEQAGRSDERMGAFIDAQRKKTYIPGDRRAVRVPLELNLQDKAYYLATTNPDKRRVNVDFRNVVDTPSTIGHEYGHVVDPKGFDESIVWDYPRRSGNADPRSLARYSVLDEELAASDTAIRDILAGDKPINYQEEKTLKQQSKANPKALRRRLQQIGSSDPQRKKEILDMLGATTTYMAHPDTGIPKVTDLRRDVQGARQARMADIANENKTLLDKLTRYQYQLNSDLDYLQATQSFIQDDMDNINRLRKVESDTAERLRDTFAKTKVLNEIGGVIANKPEEEIISGVTKIFRPDNTKDLFGSKGLAETRAKINGLFEPYMQHLKMIGQLQGSKEREIKKASLVLFDLVAGFDKVDRLTDVDRNTLTFILKDMHGKKGMVERDLNNLRKFMKDTGIKIRAAEETLIDNVRQMSQNPGDVDLEKFLIPKDGNISQESVKDSLDSLSKEIKRKERILDRSTELLERQMEAVKRRASPYAGLRDRMSPNDAKLLDETPGKTPFEKIKNLPKGDFRDRVIRRVLQGGERRKLERNYVNSIAEQYREAYGDEIADFYRRNLRRYLDQARSYRSPNVTSRADAFARMALKAAR